MNLFIPSYMQNVKRQHKKRGYMVLLCSTFGTPEQEENWRGLNIEDGGVWATLETLWLRLYELVKTAI